MKVAQGARNGSCGRGKAFIHLQNVHIEHTIPIAELSRRWTEYRRLNTVDVNDVYAWTLVHSVATAVHHKTEKGGLRHYESRTDAFNSQSRHFGLPFMRYEHMDKPPIIWNVLNGERLDPHSWTFADHFSMIDRLMLEAGGDAVLCSSIQDKARELVASLSFSPLGDLLELPLSSGGRTCT
ncbi:hypothetical protein E2F50_19975 [Rhizobium deserti]|uniref:Uncharacterized protein n=1 Tax=Rhizobium deserti TaxID=2547961 RepID=A0A4R5U9T7_9HYPH|nr:hypothetical protein [Rhizobium deserti]TDK31232.1 hypothetical protein E2F50_19975 [Rhizobium deserti]